MDYLSAERHHAFFVEWRITDASIIRAVADLHSELAHMDPSLQLPQSCASDNLHVTMNEMQLDDQSELDKALQVMQDFAKKDFPSLAEGKKIRIGGVDHFRNQVLFLKLQGDDNAQDPLSQMYDRISNRLAAANLSPKNSRPFKPHLTVCKAPRGKGKTIPAAVLSRVRTLERTLSGEQVLDQLVFCVRRLSHEATPPIIFEIKL